MVMFMPSVRRSAFFFALILASPRITRINADFNLSFEKIRVNPCNPWQKISLIAMAIKNALPKIRLP